MTEQIICPTCNGTNITEKSSFGSENKKLCLDCSCEWWESKRNWNGCDCNTCPLRTWTSCWEICRSRSTMIFKIATLNDTYEHYEARAYVAEADRDHWKARAEALERAFKAYQGGCENCIHQFKDVEKMPCNECEEGDFWEFNQACFAELEKTRKDGE